MDLNALRMFAMVVSKGSFSSAAQALNIPVATVSRRVAMLELEIDSRLLERSTRSLRLTMAGKVLYEFAARGVEEFETGLLVLKEQQSQMAGHIRLSIPSAFSPMWALVGSFQKHYPNVVISVFSTERRVDFIEDGMDVALRVGDRQSRSSMVRHLGEYRHKLVATPEFLGRHPVGKPEDLKAVPCIVWGYLNREIIWQLGDQAITITPKLQVNDYLHLKAVVATGEYVTELPPFLCRDMLESNKLVEVLPEAPLPELSLSLLYPSKRNLAHTTRVFVDYIVNNFRIALET